MDKSMDGKSIDGIYWPDTNDGQRHQIFAPDTQYDLHLSVTHHGDHDEIWVIQSINGKEVARHNPRYLETIVWTP